jgi:peptidoglycan/xylan/chitin deacetylase (PgdA/CDA1 family)
MTANIVRPRSRRAVTLCFHGVGTPDRRLEHGEERFWIGVDQFSDIVEAVRSHPRQADLTFDDSNESDFLHALPLLRRMELSARFFVITNRLNTVGSLSSEQLFAIHEAGMSIGTHGMTHESWRDLAALQMLDEELTGSAQVLENITRLPVTEAALPRGQYDRQVLAALRRQGFNRVYSVDEGTSRRTSWLRSRYTIIDRDTPASVTAFLDDPDQSTLPRLLRAAKNVVKGLR